MPRVSVLMTVYNGMPYLPLAMDSIFNQTLGDFEFIVVNDGSTDATADYLAGVEDSRLKVVHRSNGGTAAAANEGLRHCQGEYIARMDSDDISLPTRLEEQVAFLDAHPNVGLVGAQMAPLGDGGIGKSLIIPTQHAEIYQALLDGKHGMAHSCITLRRELLTRVGGYWEHDLQDAWDLMLRVGEAADLANLDRVLHHYRVHRGSLNGRGMQRMRFSIDYACELARRRQTNQPRISPEQFAAQRAGRPIWKRWAEQIDLYARCHYRLALAEIHGNRRAKGYARMMWAAVCQPRLTVERVARILANRLHRRKSTS